MSSRRKRRTTIFVFLIFLFLFLVLMSVKNRLATQQNAQGISVMTVGSSVAEGWVDTQGGYLARGFTAYGQAVHRTYTIVRKAQAGDTSTKIEKNYKNWLISVKPKIVVISWGGLDDANAKTPMVAYRSAIHQQVALALATHAVVIIVTPPVTRASYTQFKVQEEVYLDTEMQVARAFHSPNVYVCDVFHQMEQYLVMHHQTYKPYMADGWHPNSQGHILGGQLLEQDLNKLFGTKAITFRN
nr:SGNH/GDSL hydrolase family protein [Bacilli bacterium]